MNRNLTAIFLMGVLSPLITTAKMAGQQSGPTIEQTDQFLTNHLNNVSHPYSIYDEAFEAHEWISFSNGGCTVRSIIVLTKTASNDPANDEFYGPAHARRYEFQIDAGKLKIAGIRAPTMTLSRNFVYWYIAVPTDNDTENDSDGYGDTSDVHFLVSSDQSTADRVANAFKGLARLCGAKDEVY